MSSNNHLIKVGDIKIDDRMSEETKTFMLGFLSVCKPSDFLKQPVQSIRNIDEENETRLIQTLKFENLPNKYTQIFIKNPTDGYEIPLWVFSPSDAAKNAPIVIFFHGGGWSLGSPKSYYHLVSSLASKSKSIWISVDYRLAPEFKHRVQVNNISLRKVYF